MFYDQEIISQKNINFDSRPKIIQEKKKNEGKLKIESNNENFVGEYYIIKNTINQRFIAVYLLDGPIHLEHGYVTVPAT